MVLPGVFLAVLVRKQCDTSDKVMLAAHYTRVHSHLRLGLVHGVQKKVHRCGASLTGTFPTHLAQTEDLDRSNLRLI